jgi:hypothetical protein
MLGAAQFDEWHYGGRPQPPKQRRYILLATFFPSFSARLSPSSVIATVVSARSPPPFLSPSPLPPFEFSLLFLPSLLSAGLSLSPLSPLPALAPVPFTPGRLPPPTNHTPSSSRQPCALVSPPSERSRRVQLPASRPPFSPTVRHPSGDTAQ